MNFEKYNFTIDTVLELLEKVKKDIDIELSKTCITTHSSNSSEKEILEDRIFMEKYSNICKAMDLLKKIWFL